MLARILSFFRPQGRDLSGLEIIRALKRSGYTPDPRFVVSRVSVVTFNSKAKGRI